MAKILNEHEFLMQFSLPTLEKEEELLLFEIYQKTHDPKVHERLVRSNLGLIIKTISCMRNLYSDTEEMISVGLVKLHDAIETFNTKRGYRFGTYFGTVLFNAYLRTETNEKKQKNGRMNGLNIDHFCPHGFDMDQFNSLMSIRDVIERNLANLDDVELFIIKEYYGWNGHEPKTMHEMSLFIGLTGGRIQQKHQKAIEKIKKVLDR
ncbi:MAG: sigma-70 family RNA polymerase sigma factor [Desulfobacteraceae bacterium]|jgi:RNA polymerase sigma factor (sigma-70 family)